MKKKKNTVLFRSDMIALQFGILKHGQVCLEALCFYYTCKTPGSPEQDLRCSLWLYISNVAVTGLSFTLKRNYKVLALCLEQLQMVRKDFCTEVRKYIAVIELGLSCLYQNTGFPFYPSLEFFFPPLPFDLPFHFFGFPVFRIYILFLVIVMQRYNRWLI